MKMFLGEYNPNITEGSRLALPKKIREQMRGEKVVMSRGFEKCVLIYDINDWAAQAQKQVANLSGTLKTSDLERYLYTSAVEAPIDTQGRVVVPGSLMEYANVTSKTAVIGVGDHVEVWDADAWRKHLEKITAQLSS